MMLSKNSSNNYCNQADLPGLFLNPLGKVVSNFNRDLGTFVQIGDMFQFVLRQLLGPRPNWHPLILKKNQDKLKWDLIASRFVLTDDNYKPFFCYIYACVYRSVQPSLHEFWSSDKLSNTLIYINTYFAIILNGSEHVHKIFVKFFL